VWRHDANGTFFRCWYKTAIPFDDDGEERGSMRPGPIVVWTQPQIAYANRLIRRGLPVEDAMLAAHAAWRQPELPWRRRAAS
jgi:hypothetical protein